MVELMASTMVVSTDELLAAMKVQTKVALMVSMKESN
jgi:hypothetical protein